jgi:protoporphyrinogen/coproporphyrinogen III oxidase
MTRRALVIGAGIAGLTAAFRLQQSGYEVRVFEAEDHVGGRMSTVKKNGYILDIGASVLTSRYTQMCSLAAEVGLSDELIATNDEVAFWRDGTIHRMRGHVLSDPLRSKLLSLRGKLDSIKLMLDSRKFAKQLDFSDLSKMAGKDTETISRYAKRRLTPEVRDYLVDPMVRALWQGSMEDFSTVDLFFAIQNFFGGILINSLDGVDFLARGLAERLDVELNATVQGVEEHSDRVEVAWSRPGEPDHVEEADFCIVALTAHDMAKIYPQLDEQRRDIISSFRYSTLWTVHIGIDRVPNETCVFIQIPKVNHPDMTVVALEHNKCDGRAPAGKGLLNSCWLTEWYHKHAHLSDAEVVDKTLEGISMVLPNVEQHVEFFNVKRWSAAVMLSGPGTWTSMARFHQLTPKDGRIHVAGDYIGGSTTNSALSSGERAAQLVLAARPASQRSRS